MRRKGAAEGEILAALRAANERRCRPPLGDEEIRKLAEDVAQRYEPTGPRPDIGGAPPALVDVQGVFAEYLYLPDPAVVDVVLAAYVANHLTGDSCWLSVIGAPSRGKTEVISALAGLDDVYMLSTLTGNTFASGMKKDRSSSLLYRLQDSGKRVLVVKDFSTILTMHPEARAHVFGALREIFDGRFNKPFGTGEEVNWEGKLGLVAGVTPVIDRHHTAIAQLGDRFLSLRLPEVPRERMAERSLASWGNERNTRGALRDVVRRFLSGVGAPDLRPSRRILDDVGPVADLATHARTAVYRDPYTKEIDDMPELEAPARMWKELAGLCLGLQALGDDEESSIAMARRVAGDSVPPGRVAVLALLAEAGAQATTTSTATRLGTSTNTARRWLEDLAALRLVRRSSQGAGKADLWALTEDGAQKWAGAGW